MAGLQDKRRPAILFLSPVSSRTTARTTTGSRKPRNCPGAYREGNEENLDLRAIRASPRRVPRCPTPIRFVASEGHDRRNPRSLCAAVPVRLRILGGKVAQGGLPGLAGREDPTLWKRTLSPCPDEDRHLHECQHGMVRWKQK